MSTAGPPHAQQWPRVLLIALVLVLLAGLTVVLLGVGQRAVLVAAFEREVGANNDWALWSQKRGLRATAAEWLGQLLSKSGSDRLYRDRLQAIIGEPVDTAAIVIRGALPGDPSAALVGFPHVRAMYFQENSAGPSLVTEAQWAQQCSGIRNLPGVIELRLKGSNLNDAALTPLAGHPAVATLELGSNRMTAQGFQTLATLPCLSELTIGPPSPSGGASSDLTEQKWALVCRESKTLPHLQGLVLKGRTSSGNPTLTDAAIAPLAGHPTLETLTLSDHALTPASASTFNAMPRLKIVNLGPDSRDFQSMNALRAAAPRILIRR